MSHRKALLIGTGMFCLNMNCVFYQNIKHLSNHKWAFLYSPCTSHGCDWSRYHIAFCGPRVLFFFSSKFGTTLGTFLAVYLAIGAIFRAEIARDSEYLVASVKLKGFPSLSGITASAVRVAMSSYGKKIRCRMSRMIKRRNTEHIVNVSHEKLSRVPPYTRQRLYVVPVLLTYNVARSSLVCEEISYLRLRIVDISF